MLLLRDLSMLWSLLHILVLFMMLYRSRYSRKKTILLTGISMGFLILLNMTGLVLYGAEVMGKVFILTCTLPSLLVFWFISKDRNGRFFYILSGGHSSALGYHSNQVGGLLFWRWAVYSHVYRQACNVSMVGICGSSLHQETIYGASGGSAKRMGDFCGHDGALLYPACYYGEFSRDDHQ